MFVTPASRLGRSRLVRGQLVGTNTNDSANAGNVGEYISSNITQGSAVSVSNGVAANVTSISLTPGDWDVWGSVVIAQTGSTSTIVVAWTSTTSASEPTYPNFGGLGRWDGSVTGGVSIMASTGLQRFSLSTTTTVYLSTRQNFSGGTQSAYGFIGARRRR